MVCEATKHERATIEVTAEEDEVCAAAVRALARLPGIYQRAGALVEVQQDPPIGSESSPPSIRVLPIARVRERLSAAAHWVKRCKDKESGETFHRKIHVPQWAAQGVAALGSWPGIPYLHGIVEVPVLRPDGTVHQIPGYDAETGLLLVPIGRPQAVPDAPSRDDAVRCAGELLEVVADVPFESAAHRAAWLAAALTPFARHAFSGPVPLTLTTANAPGAGKGLVLNSIGVISTGRDLYLMSNTNNDEEMRKRITTLALKAVPLVLLDNIKDVFGTPSLDAALTSTSWGDRVLGANESMRTHLRILWFATGNNIDLNGDLGRRTLHIRLDSAHENPESRTDFKHSNLLEWLSQERDRLACAAVTLLRGYCVAERPDMKLPAWGSFEGWSRLIRHAVVWTGQPDPAETRASLREEADTTAFSVGALLRGWKYLDTGDGLTVRQAIDRLGRHTDDSTLHDFRDAIDELTGRKPGTPIDATKLGWVLRRFKGRVLGGLRFVRLGQSRDGVQRWRAMDVGGARGDESRYGIPRTSPAADSSAPGCAKTNDAGDAGDRLQQEEEEEKNKYIGGGAPEPSPSSPAPPQAETDQDGTAESVADLWGD